MIIPIKTIEEVKSKSTINSAYLFIDAADNILKMKINDKFYSFNLTGNGNLEPDNPATPNEPSVEIEEINVEQSVLGVVFEIGATSSVAHNDIMGLFVNENETDYVCVDNSDIKIIYYPSECEDVYEDANGFGTVTLSNRYVLKNATTGEIYAISNPSNNILNFYSAEITPGCCYGAVDAKPIYKNYEIKWDGNSNNIVVGKYTYIEEEKKWIKINENGELNSSLYLKLYNYLSSYTTYAFIVVYHNDDPMYASFSNPDFPGYLLDDEGNLIAEYPPTDCTNKNGIKMTGLGFGYNDDGGEGLFKYSERFGINVESFYGDLDTVDCPTLWFENIDAYYKKSESERGV